jgi:hypothetical protein
MKRTIGIMSAVVLLGSVPAGVALAGVHAYAPVSISTSQRRAEGSLGSARNGSIFDTTQYIGCWLRAESANPNLVGGCSARIGSTTATCSFPASAQSQDFAWAMHAMGPDALVRFTWNSSGVCLTLHVEQNSKYEPKLP